MQKLNTMGFTPPVTNQVVEVKFPGGGKNYSYVGSGNLRTGQEVTHAPVTHHKSGKNYTVPKPVRVVATHRIAGAQVGDQVGVSNGRVKRIPTGLKYLPGVKDQQLNRDINIRGKKMRVSDYMKSFGGGMQKLNTMGGIGKNG